MLTVDPEGGVLKGTDLEERVLEDDFAFGAGVNRTRESKTLGGPIGAFLWT